jgi:hypothetical protein
VGLLPRQFHTLEKKCPPGVTLEYVDKSKNPRVPGGVDFVFLCIKFTDHHWTQYVRKHFHPSQVVLVGRWEEEILARIRELTIIKGGRYK